MRNLFLLLLINAREGLCSLRVYISRGKMDAVCLSMLQCRHILRFLCFLLSKCPPLFSKLILQLKCDQQHHCKESKSERVREKFLSLASICPFFFFTLKLRDSRFSIHFSQACLKNKSVALDHSNRYTLITSEKAVLQKKVGRSFKANIYSCWHL